MRILDILVLDLRFYLLLTIWVIGCIIFHPFAYAILPVVIVLGHRERYFEVLILFLFVLILSDSTDPLLMWSQSFKNILVLTFGLIFLLKYRSFSTEGGIIRYFLPFFAIALLCLAYSPIPIIWSQKNLSYFLVYIIIPKIVLEAIKIK